MSKTRPGIITPQEGRLRGQPVDLAIADEAGLFVAEPQWSAWAVIARDGGWVRARVLLPESVVQRYALAIDPPDVRSIVASKIELDVTSDRLVDRRGWER